MKDKEELTVITCSWVCEEFMKKMRLSPSADWETRGGSDIAGKERERGRERMKERDSKIIKSATISSPLSLREKKRH